MSRRLARMCREILHAQTLEQILNGRYLSRPDWADGLEIFAIAVLGSLLVILTTFVSPAVGLACGLAITALAVVASWLCFSYAGLLFDPLAPIISGSVTHFAATSFRILVIDRKVRGSPRFRAISVTIASLSYRAYARRTAP